MRNQGKYHYDVELLAVDTSRKRLDLRLGREIITAQSACSVIWPAGTVGSFRFLNGSDHCAFEPYMDQRLRRFPELDEKKPLRWAWRVGDRIVHARPHVTPGTGGALVRDGTTLVHLPIPPEFVEFCRLKKLTPHTVLRAFIADLCGVRDLLAYPREGRFCTNGVDERLRANDYFYRTFGWRRTE